MNIIPLCFAAAEELPLWFMLPVMFLGVIFGSGLIYWITRDFWR